MKDNPHIFVCPLDWGIGHATRCVPVIRELIRQKAKVTIGADNRPLAFLRQEFPDAEFIRFPGYRFSYPTGKNMALKMAIQLPQILIGIRKEREALEKIVRERGIDGIISDNRFGLSSTLVPSVFMTHQLRIQVPSHLGFLKPILDRINHRYISAFDECWIPDFKTGLNLSGNLGHVKDLLPNCHYIGPLSRFAGMDINKLSDVQDENNRLDILVILSGPEPQRTLLEKKVLQQIQQSDYKAAVILGKPESGSQEKSNGRITIFPHLDTGSLYRLIMIAGIIISRPGYSTVMDIATTGKKAVFIPTPGQTEQEYLAGYYTRKKWFFSTSQKNFQLDAALVESKSFSGIRLDFDYSILTQRIASFLQKM
jgi:uncharacterized protein (TIGR00661 family)